MRKIWSLVIALRSVVTLKISPPGTKTTHRRAALFAPITTIVPLAALAISGDASKETKTGQSEFISGLAGGAAQRITKDLVLHPIDTVKTRLQRAGSRRLTRRVFVDPFAGILTPLIIGVPAGALFFGVKDATAVLCKGYNEDFVELTTVAVANGPYWLLRSPSELIKVRQQLDQQSNLTGIQMAQDIIQNEGLSGLYVGAIESYAYALPTDLVKFFVYRRLKKSSLLSASITNPVIKKAALGSLASASAQLVTTPLDVVRTRAMDRPASSSSDGLISTGGDLSILARAQAILRDEGLGALWAGISPRLLRALVSGGLQFGSYEFTKRAFNKSPP